MISIIRGKKAQKVGALVLTLALILGTIVLPANVDSSYAATPNLTATEDGSFSVVRGESGVLISYTVKNDDSTPHTFNSCTLEVSPDEGITVSSGNSSSNFTINQGDTMSFAFTLNLDKNVKVGNKSLTLKLGGANPWSRPGTNQLQVSEKLNVPSSGDGKYIALVDITSKTTPTNGFEIGSGNSIALEIFNRGNSIIREAKMEVVLPEVMSPDNSSNTMYLGSVSVGSRKNVSFPIIVDKTATSKSYPLTFKISGRDYSENTVSMEQTFYVPVNGGSSTGVNDLTITDIGIPQQVPAGDDFILSFGIKNDGAGEMKNLKISAEVPEGIVNKSKTIFVEKSLAKGTAKNYSITLSSDSSAAQKSYPIKITVETAASGTDTTASSQSQYTSVFLKQLGGNAKTPQLMIDSYNYGGTYVQAGSKFSLRLGLYNTSNKNITNIKVKVTAEEGTFIPVGSSSSFFVDSIDAKGHASKAIDMTAKRQAEQKTVAVTIAMSYEDGAGNAFTAEDVISVPVIQEMRLSVDEITSPMVFAGQPASAEVQFYNMGQSTLNNLRIAAQGDFDTMENISYFVGNMEKGKSDTYSFNFVPRKQGPLEGKVVFTYEDGQGAEQVYEIPFNFEVQEEMPMPEDPGMMEPEKKSLPIGWIIGGVAALLLIVGAVVILKIRKRRLHKAMEIADANFGDDMDIDEDEILQVDSVETQEVEKNGKTG